MDLVRRDFIQPDISPSAEEDGFRFRHGLIRDAALRRHRARGASLTCTVGLPSGSRRNEATGCPRSRRSSATTTSRRTSTSRSLAGPTTARRPSPQAEALVLRRQARARWHEAMVPHPRRSSSGRSRSSKSRTSGRHVLSCPSSARRCNLVGTVRRRRPRADRCNRARTQRRRPAARSRKRDRACRRAHLCRGRDRAARRRRRPRDSDLRGARRRARARPRVAISRA